MAHLKRQKIPKNWPIKRKGSAFLVRPSSNIGKGLPILVILRNYLGIAQNRKEVKKALHEKNILLNGRPVQEEKNTAVLFDVITIVPSKTNYKVVLSKKGKFAVEEIKENEAGKKISKIVNKKILKGKKVQLNLSDGRNILSDIKCSVNDSLVLNPKEKKIEKCLKLKENSRAFVFSGKHAGKEGVIEKIKPERKMVKMNVEGKEVNVLIKQIMVIE